MSSTTKTMIRIKTTAPPPMYICASGMTTPTHEGARTHYPSALARRITRCVHRQSNSPNAAGTSDAEMVTRVTNAVAP
jgi:hypothetical protein